MAVVLARLGASHTRIGLQVATTSLRTAHVARTHAFARATVVARETLLPDVAASTAAGRRVEATAAVCRPFHAGVQISATNLRRASIAADVLGVAAKPCAIVIDTIVFIAAFVYAARLVRLTTEANFFDAADFR